jgi:hypothetical protein
MSYTMSERSHHITHVLLRVAADLGHNGLLSEYRIDSDNDGYTVALRISKPCIGLGSSPVPPPPPSQPPRPLLAYGKDRFEPGHRTEVLVKDHQQVEEFLRRLSTEFNVYELADLKPSYPFLHPTFYSFSFRDSAGKSHSFTYAIECAHHLDEQYKELIQEFDSFFESSRVFDAFFKSQRRNR